MAEQVWYLFSSAEDSLTCKHRYQFNWCCEKRLDTRTAEFWRLCLVARSMSKSQKYARLSLVLHLCYFSDNAVGVYFF